MTNVYTKEQLREAIRANEKVIVLHGDLAKKLRNSKKFAKIAASVTAVSAAAVPFTGGLSGAGVAIGAGLSIGSLTISIAELALILGFTLSVIALMKNYNVKFNPDGSVELSRS